jgi:heme/copper-type cytochrome/quinol oxidase subunit 3
LKKKLNYILKNLLFYCTNYFKYFWFFIKDLKKKLLIKLIVFWETYFIVDNFSREFIANWPKNKEKTIYQKIMNDLNKEYTREDQMRDIYKYMITRRQRHKWHIVSPSVWPIYTASSVFIFVFGFVCLMHFIAGGLFLLLIGLILFIGCLFGWFRDIIRESVYMGYHTIQVQENLRLGFVLFIVSEVMFFFSFFWAYFHCSFSPSIWIGCIRPPEGIVYFFLYEKLYNDHHLFKALVYPNEFNKFLFKPYYLKFKYLNFFSSFEVGYMNLGFDNLVEYSFLRRYFWVAHVKPPAKDLFYTANQRIIYSSEFRLSFKNFFWSLFNDSSNKPDELCISMIKLFKKLKLTCSCSELDSINDYVAANNTRSKSLKTRILKFNILDLIFYDKGVLMNPYKVPFLNTITLLTSGGFLTLSHSYLRLSNFQKAIRALFITLVFACYFIGCQFYEYSHAMFSINDGIYGSVFYMLTGFHGFHVIIGTIFLIVCYFRFQLAHFTRTDHLGYECAIWYWHFVDVVWILLYLTLYFWPNIYFFKGSYYEFWFSNFSFFHNFGIKLTFTKEFLKSFILINDVTFPKLNLMNNIEDICSYNINKIKRVYTDYFFFKTAFNAYFQLVDSIYLTYIVEEKIWYFFPRLHDITVDPEYSRFYFFIFYGFASFFFSRNFGFYMFEILKRQIFVVITWIAEKTPKRFNDFIYTFNRYVYL